jgi:hypothetical protein
VRERGRRLALGPACTGAVACGQRRRPGKISDFTRVIIRSAASIDASARTSSDPSQADSTVAPAVTLKAMLVAPLSFGLELCHCQWSPKLHSRWEKGHQQGQSIRRTLQSSTSRSLDEYLEVAK